ncbi:MAG: sugar phosphate isomerase/epimerase [Gemmataceae bacterium]|nr:sugar phosphate isomerase/epimerase [Gemmataceae bacterium]
MFPSALHSVSYAGVWQGQARLTLPEFIDQAKALGFDAVMLMAKRPHLSPLDFDEGACRDLGKRIADAGLKVACLAGYTDFCLGLDRGDIPTREMQVLYVRELGRLARAVGCDLIRVFTGYDDQKTPFDQQWALCVAYLKECAKQAARFGVTLGIQNHHDTAVHFESLADLLAEIDEPNCKVIYDAWAPALHGMDPTAGVRVLGRQIVHTTVADYVRRPRFRYHPQLVNYSRESDAIRAVPVGEGFIDYRRFLATLKEIGYRGYVAYEMCSPLRGGGSLANLDRCARRFLEWLRSGDVG